MKWLLYKQQEVLQNLNHSFYQEDLAYVHDMGYGEHAKHADAFLLEQLESLTLDRNILLFKKINDLYRKSREVHRLQLYERSEIKKLLEKVGFSVTLLDNYDGLQFREKHVGFLAIKGNSMQ